MRRMSRSNRKKVYDADRAAAIARQTGEQLTTYDVSVGGAVTLNQGGGIPGAPTVTKEGESQPIDTRGDATGRWGMGAGQPDIPYLDIPGDVSPTKNYGIGATDELKGVFGDEDPYAGTQIRNPALTYGVDPSKVTPKEAKLGAAFGGEDELGFPSVDAQALKDWRNYAFRDRGSGEIDPLQLAFGSEVMMAGGDALGLSGNVEEKLSFPLIEKIINWKPKDHLPKDTVFNRALGLSAPATLLQAAGHELFPSSPEQYQTPQEKAYTQAVTAINEINNPELTGATRNRLLEPAPVPAYDASLAPPGPVPVGQYEFDEQSSQSLYLGLNRQYQDIIELNPELRRGGSDFMPNSELLMIPHLQELGQMDRVEEIGDIRWGMQMGANWLTQYSPEGFSVEVDEQGFLVGEIDWTDISQSDIQMMDDLGWIERQPAGSFYSGFGGGSRGGGSRGGGGGGGGSYGLNDFASPETELGYAMKQLRQTTWRI